MGCGHGVLADLLARRGAHVTAVDLDLGGPFDAVVSFDVRAFWTPPAPEWDVVARVLAPGGRVVVAFSVMAEGHERRVREEVSRLASPRGLTVTGEHRAGTAPFPSAAVVLGPA